MSISTLRETKERNRRLRLQQQVEHPERFTGATPDPRWNEIMQNELAERSRMELIRIELGHGRKVRK